MSIPSLEKKFSSQKHSVEEEGINQYSILQLTISSKKKTQQKSVESF